MIEDVEDLIAIESGDCKTVLNICATSRNRCQWLPRLFLESNAAAWFLPEDGTSAHAHLRRQCAILHGPRMKEDVNLAVNALRSLFQHVAESNEAPMLMSFAGKPNTTRHAQFLLDLLKEDVAPLRVTSLKSGSKIAIPDKMTMREYSRIVDAVLRYEIFIPAGMVDDDALDGLIGMNAFGASRLAKPLRTIFERVEDLGM